METDKKKVTAEAAKRVVANSATQITDVIESDGDLHLSDRVATSAAAFVLCGLGYFLVWLFVIIGLQWITMPWVNLVSRFFYTWRLPLLATLITTLAAFVAPSWAIWVFGALMKRAKTLLNWIHMAIGNWYSWWH
jgi:uncharacterized membrane protein